MTAPLLPARDAERLRDALAGYTVGAVDEVLGWPGRAAAARGDLAGVARAVRAAGDDPIATLARLFLLGEPVEERVAARAMGPFPLDRAGALLEVSAGEVRAGYEIRPYGEDGADDHWLVVSDFGADVRHTPLPRDHVLGIGSASTTLAQATPRTPVGRALDLGTGCGVQALHLGRHAGAITATDLSRRALACAATTALLSGTEWDLRAGSLLEPVDGETFDLVVANPPFVVSPGTDGYEYRDSGRPGDALCADLVRSLPAVLAPGGCAQLLANWVIPVDGTAWTDRVEGWLAGSDCDAWVWQREVAEPAEYVALWLRDAGLDAASPEWTARYDTWLDWFAAAGVAAVGMGLVTLWRPPLATAGPSGAGGPVCADGAGGAPRVVVLEDVPQAVEPPVGALLPGWIARQRRLAALPDADLLRLALRVADDVVLTRDELPAAGGGWRVERSRLRQARGLRWEVETDEALAGLVAACDGRAPLGLLLDVLAAALGADPAEVRAASLPVVRDLVGRGLLDLPDPAGHDATGAG